MNIRHSLPVYQVHLQQPNSTTSSLGASQSAMHHPQTQGQLLATLQDRLVYLEQNHGRLEHRVGALQQQGQTNHQQLVNMISNLQQPNLASTSPVAPPIEPRAVSPVTHQTTGPEPIMSTVHLDESPTSPDHRSESRHYELKFDKLIKDTSSEFEEWTISSKRKIYLNPLTRSALDGNMDLKADMEYVVQVKIFDALITAIQPKKSSAYISKEKVIRSDAKALMDALTKRHGTKSKNALVHQQLQQDFESIKRGQREGYDKYLDRYIQLQEESAIVKLPLPSTIHYLCSLQVEALAPIITELAEDNPTMNKWYENGLAHTHGLAMDRITVTKLVRKEQDTNSKTKEVRETREPNTRTNTKDLTDFIKKLKEIFPKKPTAEQIVQKSKDLQNCPLHPKGHSMIQCYHFRAAAVDLKWFNVWEQAIELAEKERQEKRQNRNTNNTPAPTPPPRQNQNQGGGARTNNQNINDTNETVEGYSQHLSTVENHHTISRQIQQARLTENDNTLTAKVTSINQSQIPPPAPTTITSKAARKWSHFPPNTIRKFPKDVPLPAPTSEEENFLHRTDRCWDIINSSVLPDSPHVHTMVTDSGTRNNISSNLEHFDEIHMFQKTERPYVKLADDQTKVPIHGYGTIDIMIRDKRVRLTCLYVPTMPTMLLSISQHIQYTGCSFIAEHNAATLTFPTFYISVDNEDEFSVPVMKANKSTTLSYDETTATLVTENDTSTTFTMADSGYSEYVQQKSTWKQEKAYFRKLISKAVLPLRATEGSAGLDLSSINNVTLKPGTTTIVKTGLQSSFSPDIYMRIAPRSSMSIKNIQVTAEVIDSDYRGEIGVVLYNASTEPYKIKRGDRIAQAIFERLSRPQIILSNDELPKSNRHNKGFGSTGKNRLETHEINGDLFLIDRTRGPHRVRARRVQRPSTIQIQHTTTQHPPENTSKSTAIIPYDHSKYPPLPILSDVEDYLEFIAPTETMPSTPATDPEHEDNIIEVYTDYPFAPAGRPTTQRSDALSTAPSDTNLSHQHPQNPTNFKSHLTNSESKPRLSIEDSPNTALPKTLRISKHQLLQSIGFLSHNDVIKNISKIAKKGTIELTSDYSPKKDIGEHATMDANRRSKTIDSRKYKYGDVWHVDIGFGPSLAIGGAKYCMLFVDKSTRESHVFKLQNLTQVHLAMQQFITKVGRSYVGELRTDFDHKIIGGKCRELLNRENIPIKAAPPRRQSQNGLVESRWKQIIKMTRNWITSALLPTTFWWFGVKRAVEVSNTAIPTFHHDKNNPTTPFELVHKRKPDLRNLIPMFSIADIKIDKEQGGHHRQSIRSQTLRTICVGLSHKADCAMFYHPPSKQTIHSDTYKFDTYMPAGPQFKLNFDGDFVFNTRSDYEQCTHKPCSHEKNADIYVKYNDKIEKGKIIDTPMNKEEDPFYIQLDNHDIHPFMVSDIHLSNPELTPLDIPIKASDPPHLPWITDGAKVTLVPPGSSIPKQGYLKHSKDIQGEWEFHPGRSGKQPKVPLPKFQEILHSMISSKKLFKGWKNLRFATTARFMKGISNLVARHISAKNLSILTAPSLSKHTLLPEPDRGLWDAAYAEEYFGLLKLGTWEIVSEADFKRLKEVTTTNTLPSMAISTIKKDGEGNPKRCKYRIVALGNLDPHNWTKTDCFAPVLSQLEHRSLMALAARLKCIPKTGDVSQAFCQSTLPDNEQYYIRPPSGCPHTPPDSYLKLKRTLYGLKRSPRHWYEKAKQTLLSIGFKQCPNAPCIFQGTLIPNEPPIYLGLYVDDFTYFSQSRKVEDLFETKFSEHLNVTFEEQIDYFLGINHVVTKAPNGNITIKMDQSAFIEALLQTYNLHLDHVGTPTSPFKSGLPVDKIRDQKYSPTHQAYLTHTFQSIVGSLTWLSTSTRPDIATITNILAKYSSKPSEGHIAHAKYVLRYLKGTIHHGIEFKSEDNDQLQSFLKFPIEHDKVLALTDANWGPQDQSKPRPDTTEQLNLFKSRSLSGYLIWLGGPLHWSAKRQAITARSSAESEIYATDECVKQLQHLHHIFEDLQVIHLVMPTTTPVYNDNAACVYWSHSMTTKGLRHIQIRENAIREAILSKHIDVKHVAGKVNLADLFTKEQKDPAHFILIRDIIMTVCK